MYGRYILPALLLCTILATGGCLSPISKSIRKEIDRQVTFSELRQNPDAFVGKVVLFGGTIVKVQNQKEDTLLEILEKRLDPWAKPYEEDASGGRFLVSAPGFLDPAIYREGRQVTVAGAVTGKVIQRLGDIDYQYPLLAARQIYLWPEYQDRIYYPYPAWYYWDMYRFPYRPWM